MTRLLLIDDDPLLLLDQLRHVFAGKEMQIAVARSGQEGLKQFMAEHRDVVLLDVNMPDLPGLEVHQRLRKVDARIPVIFITATSTTDSAIEAMRQGAFDYLFKPVDLQQLEKAVWEAVDVGRRMREPTRLGESTSDADVGDSIIGRCAPMLEVYKAIGRVSDQNVFVLITGESGTGKELVARAIYQHGGRAEMPFMAINCAAVPEALLESELFGHEKGSFTGADRRRIGKFEQCNGGTIFLDEVGDMPLATQAKMLRLLHDQHFERVGGNQTIATDVRVIAATNHDLKALSETGKFRPDLYYRLSVFSISLPALRERGDDLPLLIDFYIRRFNRELGRDIREVEPGAVELLGAYSWPGNVRELQSVLKQAMLQAYGNVLTSGFLPNLRPAEQVPASSAGESDFDIKALIRDRLHSETTHLSADIHFELDRILLELTLKFTGGNQIQGAKILGISRETLRKRLRELGLHITKSISGDDEMDSP